MGTEPCLYNSINLPTESVENPNIPGIGVCIHPINLPCTYLASTKVTLEYRIIAVLALLLALTHVFISQSHMFLSAEPEEPSRMAGHVKLKARISSIDQILHDAQKHMNHALTRIYMMTLISIQ